MAHRSATLAAEVTAHRAEHSPRLCVFTKKSARLKSRGLLAHERYDKKQRLFATEKSGCEQNRERRSCNVRPAEFRGPRLRADAVGGGKDRAGLVEWGDPAVIMLQEEVAKAVLVWLGILRKMGGVGDC